MYLKTILLVMLFSGIIIPAYAQSTTEFDHKIHPEKLLEDTIGTIQVFVSSNNIMVPLPIAELKAVSSDTDVIKILEIKENNSKFSNEIVIKAEKSGIATIALAAPGIPSKEITIEVFNNNNLPTQLMIKATPEEFAIDGPKSGYVAVQFATTGGLPTAVQEDTVIHIETPNTDVIKISDSEIVVKEGEYYGFSKFELIGFGDAIIFAESEDMRKVSQIVKVLEPEETLEVSLTVIPDRFNSYTGTKGFAIAQLVDSAGVPVQAEEDIVLKLEVDNPDVSVNTSTDFKEVYFDSDTITIKKGEYSTYTTFTPRPTLSDVSGEINEQTFEMFVSVDDYLARGDSFTVAHDEIAALEGAGPAITQTLPFLTTGNEEIIGVTYFETEIEVSRKLENSNVRETVLVTVPVTAKDNYELGIASSDTGVLKPNNAVMEKGNNAVIITGKTGTMTTDSNLEIYITDNDGVKTVSPEPNGPSEDDIELTIEPLLPMIMAESEFPLLTYLVELAGEDEEGSSSSGDEDEEVNFRLGPTLFVRDGILTFSANEIINIEPMNVKQNQEFALSFETIEEVGSTTVEGQIGKYDGSAILTSHTTDPTTIHLGFVDNMLTNDKHLATIQLLDSVGNPVYANKDVIINLISNNENVLEVPETILVKEGEYFKTIEIETFSEGIAEIAILSEDLPLSKYEINTVEIKPTLTLDFVGSMNWNERVEAKLSVAIPDIETTLSGFDVIWETSGGEVLSEETVTNESGIASINIVPNQGNTLSVTGKISAGPFGEVSISKNEPILNIPVVEDTETISEEITPSNSIMPDFTLDTFTLLIIIIPVAVGGSLFFLKKTDRMDMITEKLPISEKIEEIKERISDIRDR